MGTLIELQEASVGEKSLFFHGGTVACQLFLTTVGSRIIEIQNIFHTGTDHLQGSVIHGSKIIRDNTVHIRSIHCSIQQHHRNLHSGIRNVFVVFFLLVDEVGTYQYNAIYFFRDQKVHGACLGIQVVTGTTQDAVIAVGTKLLLDIIDRLGKIRIRTVGTHDTDGLHSVEP